jgi:hypothetical protein
MEREVTTGRVALSIGPAFAPTRRDELHRDASATGASFTTEAPGAARGLCPSCTFQLPAAAAGRRREAPPLVVPQLPQT